MKKIYFIILFINLLGCKQSTEDKIKSALEKIDRNSTTNLEYLKIDSIHYSRGTLMDYYLSFANNEIQHAKEREELKTSTFEDLNTSFDIEPSDETILSVASLIVKLSHEIMLAKDKYNFISALAEKTDTSIIAYNITYNINYKTSDYSHEGKETAFLYANTLTPIRIDVDSIYENANPKKIYYDTTEEKDALVQNYNLQRQANNLENELQSQIAMGLDDITISETKVRIAKLKEQAAYIKVEYYWLYD